MSDCTWTYTGDFSWTRSCLTEVPGNVFMQASQHTYHPLPWLCLALVLACAVLAAASLRTAVKP